jgi:hypothetical protein
MKFALMEIKSAVYKIFKNFHVKPSERTAEPVDFIEGPLRLAINDTFVIFEKRDAKHI